MTHTGLTCSSGSPVLLFYLVRPLRFAAFGFMYATTALHLHRKQASCPAGYAEQPMKSILSGRTAK